MSFVTSKFIPNDARTTIITVASYDYKNPAGIISNKYFEEAIAFNSLTELLLFTGAILDELELPKASTNTRSFTPADTGLKPPRGENIQSPLATFKLKVLFRQNASWQGNLTWIEGSSEAPFRSVLELICLLDSALQERPPPHK